MDPQPARPKEAKTMAKEKMRNFVEFMATSLLDSGLNIEGYPLVSHLLALGSH
jgi:hypothetical protein